MRLVTAVWYQWGDVKKFVYQRREKLFGGNSMYGVPLKDVLMMIKTGATRKIIRREASAHSAVRAPVTSPPRRRRSCSAPGAR